MKRSLIALLLLISACSAGTGSKSISAQEWGADYPFTVDGYLECEPGGVIVFKGGGQTYAVNGTAQAKGYADIAPVWKDDPAIPGTKVNIGEAIAEGQKLCKP